MAGNGSVEFIKVSTIGDSSRCSWDVHDMEVLGDTV